MIQLVGGGRGGLPDTKRGVGSPLRVRYKKRGGGGGGGQFASGPLRKVGGGGNSLQVHYEKWGGGGGGGAM